MTTVATPTPSLNALCDIAYRQSAAKGFHDDDEFVTSVHRLLLIVGEIIEANEEIRDGHPLNEVYYKYDLPINGVKLKALTVEQIAAVTGGTPEQLGLTGKPEGVPVEIADTLIRIFDFCGTYGIDIESAVMEKLAFNMTREFRHGRQF